MTVTLPIDSTLTDQAPVHTAPDTLIFILCVTAQHKIMGCAFYFEISCRPSFQNKSVRHLGFLFLCDAISSSCRRVQSLLDQTLTQSHCVVSGASQPVTEELNIPQHAFGSPVVPTVWVWVSSFPSGGTLLLDR